jgi:hypothetical protein
MDNKHTVIGFRVRRDIIEEVIGTQMVGRYQNHWKEHRCELFPMILIPTYHLFKDVILFKSPHIIIIIIIIIYQFSSG